ncbi:MAG: response regulator [Planctomycetota bacterium]|jgi:signal transduction histidine kinase/ActR/RegA family two-component response regulator|nr:response regulator [Planctomycetota bacterium]
MDLAHQIDDITLALVSKAINQMALITEWREDCEKINAALAGETAPSLSAVLAQAAEISREMARICQDINELMGSVEDLNDAYLESEEDRRAKSSFLARLNHEIRTPMHTIVGINEQILHQDLPADLAGYTRLSQNAAKNLLGIINDLFDFSNLGAGKIELQPAAYDPRALVEHCVALAQAQLNGAPVKLAVEMTAALPRQLRGDSVRVQQVLTNLLNNAVKFTPAGKITLTVAGEFSAAAAFVLVLTVADTGIGIQEKHLAKVFGGFNQFDAKDARGCEGIGLGLAISRHLCRLMNGDLTVKSEFGKGSVFTARLPQTVIDATATGEGARFTAPTARVLVVDDIKVNLMVAAGVFSPYAIQIETAESGAEAVEKVKNCDYDLVLMDYMMPEMDGLEAMRAIRALRAEKYRNLPIIAFTANDDDGIKEKLLRHGFNDFLAKPIDIDLLHQIIARHLPREKQNRG